MNKIDPICGMQGHIQAHGHRFCSDHCVATYASQQGLNQDTQQETQENKRITYVLIAIIVIGGVLSWRYGVMRQFMGGFFVVVAILKLIDLKGFATAYNNYDLISKQRFNRGYVYPFIELGLGGAFLLNRNIPLVALVTFVLMVIGTIGVGIKLAKKEKFRCACLGTKLNVPLTNLTLVEDVLMGVMALMLLAGSSFFGQGIGGTPTSAVAPAPQPIPTEANDTNSEDDDRASFSGSMDRSDFTNDQKLNIHMCLMGGGEGCDVIKNPLKKDTFADAIQEQCDLMPGMQDCDTYFGVVSPKIDLGEEYDLDQKPEYGNKKTQEIVELSDGDSYEITLDNINNIIGDKPVRMMAYNQSIPGPLIKIKQDSTINLKVTNNIGDIVSTVHHHGLRGSDQEDGVPTSMGGFDTPIKKGESLEYTLEFPDPGIYWYHPHVREELQQELGMYGNYVVEPSDPTYWNPVDDEQVLILDDIQMDEDGVAPFYKDHVNQAIMGRFGTHYLVNGSEDYTLNLTQGQVTRLYVTNTANVRPFNVSIPGVEMKLVGGDLGAYEQEIGINSLLIAPAERYVVELFAPEAGSFDLVFKNPAFTETIAKVEVLPNDTVSDAGENFATYRSVSQVVEDIDQYREYFDKSVDKTLRLDMTLNGKTKEDLSLKMEHAHDGSMAMLGGLIYDLGQLEWLDEMFEMNVGSTDTSTKRQLIDEDTEKVSMMIDDWVFNQGDVVKIRIINDGEGLHPMQHPVHFHGQRFLVLNKNGEVNENLVRKDTVLTLPGEYTDILVDMSNPGKRMAHCHIAEHNESGMMMSFQVREQLIFK